MMGCPCPDCLVIPCSCGGQCWASEDWPRGLSCRGTLSVTEMYPGLYVHFCDVHDPDD